MIPSGGGYKIQNRAYGGYISSRTAKIGPVGQHHESPPKSGLLPPALPTGRRRPAWSPEKMMEVRRDK